jgi:membrane dipeptidase
MLTLTWNGKNDIASGNDTADGMSDFGREAVRALEDHRIVVDVSHLNDAGFADLLHVATRPFVASHSNSRAVCPHPRNLTDAQFGEIRDRGGLVGINYYRAFIADVPAGKDVTFDQLSRHIDHFLSLGGEKVLALGSDFDGSDTPCLACTLRRRARVLLARGITLWDGPCTTHVLPERAGVLRAQRGAVARPRPLRRS